MTGKPEHRRAIAVERVARFVQARTFALLLGRMFAAVLGVTLAEAALGRFNTLDPFVSAALACGVVVLLSAATYRVAWLISEPLPPESHDHDGPPLWAWVLLPWAFGADLRRRVAREIASLQSLDGPALLGEGRTPTGTVDDGRAVALFPWIDIAAMPFLLVFVVIYWPGVPLSEWTPSAIGARIGLAAVFAPVVAVLIAAAGTRLGVVTVRSNTAIVRTWRGSARFEVGSDVAFFRPANDLYRSSMVTLLNAKGDSWTAVATKGSAERLYARWRKPPPSETTG